MHTVRPGARRRALFIGIPLVGHLHPLIMQAAALQERGWEVAVATHDEGAAYVEARPEGVACIRLGAWDDQRPTWAELEERITREPSFVRSSTALMQWIAARWPRTFDGAREAIRAFEPEGAVVDIATSGGFDAAEQARLPVVVNNADLLGVISARLLPPADHLPLFLTGRSRSSWSRLDRLRAPLLRALGLGLTRWLLEAPLNRARRSRGLASVDIHERLRDRPILVNSAFGPEYPRALPPWIHMVGPMLPARIPALDPALDAWLCEGPPVVYASLGTIARAGAPLLQALLEGFASDTFRVLWSLRSPLASSLPRAPPANVRVEPSVPSALAVIHHPNVKAVFSHGGVNTVHEALALGKPLAVLPLFADQQEMAIRVSDAGAGVQLDKSRLTAKGVRTALERVITEPRFLAPMPALQGALRAAGGVARAAGIIEGHFSEGKLPR